MSSISVKFKLKNKRQFIIRLNINVVYVSAYLRKSKRQHKINNFI